MVKTLPIPMFVCRAELVMEVGFLIVITFVIKIRMTVVNKIFSFQLHQS